MDAQGGSAPIAPKIDRPPPENIIGRSFRAFLVAPLIQNVLMWVTIFTGMFVESGGRFVPSIDMGFLWFASRTLLASYLVAVTAGVLVHVICVKLGFRQLWHYLLAGLVSGATLTFGLGTIFDYRVSDAGMLRLAVFLIPSAVVVAVVVWVIVFWRNPPRARGTNAAPAF